MVCLGGVMLKAEQCLAKVAGMEKLASTCDPETAVSYRRLTTHWRYLAHGATETPNQFSLIVHRPPSMRRFCRSTSALKVARTY